MTSLWSSSLSLKGLFEVAAQDKSPGEGTSWLQGHVQGKLLQDAPAMARASAEMYKLADEATQQVRLKCIWPAMAYVRSRPSFWLLLQSSSTVTS